MAKLVSKLGEHRAAILTASLAQFAALLAGVLVLYSCTRENPLLMNPFQNAVYWGILGPPAVMFAVAPATLLVLGLLGVLFFLGSRWRKVRFFWYVGPLLWGAWWVFMTYILCSMADD